MRFQPAAQRRPVGPSARPRLDPLQAVFHPPADLLVQPGRAGRRRKPPPARGGRGVDGRRSLCGVGGHGRAQYIERMFRRWIRRPFSSLARKPAQPVRRLPRLAVAAGVRCLRHALRAARCALRHLRAAGAARRGAMRRLRRRIRRRSMPASPPAPTPGRGPNALRSSSFTATPGWAGALRHARCAARPGSNPPSNRPTWCCRCRSRRARLRERGFNQAHELARRLAPRKTDAALAAAHPRNAGAERPDARRAPAQSARRLRARALARDELRGRRVVLVDDVMTSGASMFAAAPRAARGRRGAHHRGRAGAHRRRA